MKHEDEPRTKNQEARSKKQEAEDKMTILTILTIFEALLFRWLIEKISQFRSMKQEASKKKREPT